MAAHDARHDVVDLARPQTTAHGVGLPHRLLGSAADAGGRKRYRSLAGRRPVAVHRPPRARARRRRDRRARAETGLSASRWLVQQRVALARRLLESTDVTGRAVADQAASGTRRLTRCDRRLPRAGTTRGRSLVE